jgi:hypothetical protein
MHTAIPGRRICVLLIAIGALVRLPAQTDGTAKLMGDALQLRGELAAAIVAGRLKTAEALTRLGEAPAPMGLGLDHEAEYALAAIDVGQRLIAGRKPAEAEPFFVEAEKSLGNVIQKTPDTAARDKATLFENRAFVRENFLNKTAGADADLAEAIALQPEDKQLQRRREMLPKPKITGKIEQPKGP